ncbi:MAG: 2-hydroxychromene-2-carboxylate isomerase [Limnohabitans sp.]|nr:2-hydroxychromene-2-carboxylate isomerase [Limnohabitans sp.]
MNPRIDYYFAPNSPWAYLGHARFVSIARQTKVQVHVMPVDLGGKVFPISGGLPLGQRAPQRQAYRLVELKRFSSYLAVPLNLKPKYFPVSTDDAAKLIVAVDLNQGRDAALLITQAVLTAVWVDELNIADMNVLEGLLKKCGLATSLLEKAHSQAAQEAYETYTQQAIDAGVFGAPSYVVDGEIFWGQDRLDFLERRVQSLTIIQSK